MNYFYDKSSFNEWNLTLLICFFDKEILPVVKEIIKVMRKEQGRERLFYGKEAFLWWWWGGG